MAKRTFPAADRFGSGETIRSLGLCGRYPISGLELRTLGIPKASWHSYGLGGGDIAWVDQ